MTLPVQVVIPMAGSGSRFTEAGYSTPKPLLPVHGAPMFALVVANLLTERVGSLTIIAQAAWEVGPSIDRLRAAISPEVRLIEIDYLTGGPADTIELARPYLDPALPVVTGNSDQYVDADLHPFYALLDDPDLAGAILTMEDDDPKWSYAATDARGDVVDVQEKVVISPYATVGIYGFSSAGLMFSALDEMRAIGDSVKGEYYVAPAYNRLIARGLRIAPSNLGPVSSVMHGMGIPADYEAFLLTEASRAAADRAHALLLSAP